MNDQRIYRTATHWGAYDVLTEAGRVEELRPVDADPDPSLIGRSIAGTLDGQARIATPMVRRGFLEKGAHLGDNARGSEPFVAIDWDEALDLVAAELDRIRKSHGNEAIFGGSYGWASAGRFHHAQSQVHRFLRCIGGYTDSVNSYSMAALEVVLPRVLGESAAQHFATTPTWEELAAHTELLVAFGGLPLRNTQVNPGGVGRHLAAAGQRHAREAGLE